MAAEPSCSLCSVLVSSCSVGGMLVASCTPAMPEQSRSPLMVVAVAQVTQTVQAVEVLVRKAIHCVCKEWVDKSTMFSPCPCVTLIK